MKKHTIDPPRLWCILIVLALAAAIVIALDTLPSSVFTSSDTLPPDETETGIGEGVLNVPGTDISGAETTDTIPVFPPVTSGPDTDAPDTTTSSEETTAEVIPPVIEDDPAITLTFLGTCSLGSPFGTTGYGSLNAFAKAEGSGYFFKNLIPLLTGDDLTVVSSDSILTDDSLHLSSVCSGPASNADIFKTGSLDCIALAPAVSSGYTDDTLASTKKAIEDRDIVFTEYGKVTVHEIDGKKIAIYHLYIEKGGDLTDALATVRSSAASSDFLTVCFWCDACPNASIEEWLRYAVHKIADAGASLIVGYGTNVLRPVEQYNTSTIAYSLGSLINGSIFHTENPSAALQLKLRTDASGKLTPEITLIPLTSSQSNWQPRLIPDGDAKKEVLNFLTNSIAPPLAVQ